MPPDIILLLVGAVCSAAMIFILWRLHGQNHPKALWLLFFTEMWERFSFYGMKALLILYMVEVMKIGDEVANLQVGGYMALVYAMPLLGGWVADNYLGSRKAIVLGGVLMAAGHFSLAVPLDLFFYLGLGFLISGNGFFKPNISSFLGRYYETTDPRKDTAFSIFYLGINVGAFLGSTLCAYLGQAKDWHLGFGTAGVFMILGLVVFLRFRHVLGDLGHPPRPQAPQPAHRTWYAIALGLVPAGAVLVYYHEITKWLLPVVGAGALTYVIWLSWRISAELSHQPAADDEAREANHQSGRKARQQIWAALLLMIGSVTWWGFFEQNAGSLNLLAKRNVDLVVGGTEWQSGTVNNAVNPAFIILLTPVFAWLWGALVRRKLEPSAPLKFGGAFLLMAVGFSMLLVGGQAAGTSGLMPLFWFIAAYFFLTASELCISPIGLSVVSKLSPVRMGALMMGMWFLATSFGGYIAGVIGAQMAVDEEKLATLNPADSLPVYMQGFTWITWVSAAAGVLLILCAPLIKRWMHGVK